MRTFVLSASAAALFIATGIGASTAGTSTGGTRYCEIQGQPGAYQQMSGGQQCPGSTATTATGGHGGNGGNGFIIIDEYY